MYLFLRLTILSLLCLPAHHGWVLKRSTHTQNEPWKDLDQLQNRELFLSALQSYFNGKGIHVDKMAPAFALPVMEQDVVVHGTQEGQALETLEPRTKE